MNPDDAYLARAQSLGFPADEAIRIGGNYLPVVVDGGQAWVSGQVPRVGERMAVTGRAGEAVDLEGARRAARICALRALGLLRAELGSLSAVRHLLRLTVYVQCSPGFTQHSEVADAASDLLAEVLGPAGRHSRTSVGVMQLPKDATVELDLVAALHGMALPELHDAAAAVRR